jgi:release factor glutamine methyltransferase
MTRGGLTAELATLLGARHEARFIVEEVLGTGGVHSDGAVIRQDDVVAIRVLGDRRAAGEPLQYVLGHWAFRSLDLLVDPRVLIPRPETEQVVEVAFRELRKLGAGRPVIVDAGTGSGAIALSLAADLVDTFPGGDIWGVDRSADALAVAQANLERVRLHCGGQLLPVTFVESAWLAALPESLQGTVTMVVSNPPYVAESEWDDLPSEVRSEPAGALVAVAGSDGTPGLGDVESVLQQSWRWLSRPGVVVIELAPHQATAASGLARSLGYLDVEVAPDLASRPRALIGWAR